MKLWQIIRRVLKFISSVLSVLGAFRKHHDSRDEGKKGNTKDE